MDSIYPIFYAITRGLRDSLQGATVLFTLDKNIRERENQIRQNTHRRHRDSQQPSVMKRIMQCCGLNGGLFWLSMLLFEYGLLPTLNLLLTVLFGHESGTRQLVWSWLQPALSCIFGTIWVIPLFFLSKFINNLWFQDIANSAYRYSRGRPVMLSNFSKLIADFLFSILVQTLFLIQSYLVSLLPLAGLGKAFALLHTCLLYSLYSFEYKWINMGWELHHRLTFIECNWPYFIGFGLPLTILTQLPTSYVVSGCVFSILFPLFIISGNEASPETGACAFPLQLFSPVIVISNAIFNRSIGSASSRR
ncbi:hypothetical protein ONE63_008695 [Megalurothrips usitatus]|uniref:Etoposide-induced protein 2.4 homolog n=1 Tax=Megalurothrips usitatus TaxID=439358 RepID=A0AAV7XPF7_9NEOP|nr:hypothetical protein ONE63_008695 [Megalurothrips usitatus]